MKNTKKRLSKNSTTIRNGGFSDHIQLIVLNVFIFCISIVLPEYLLMRYLFSLEGASDPGGGFIIAIVLGLTAPIVFVIGIFVAMFLSGIFAPHILPKSDVKRLNRRYLAGIIFTPIVLIAVVSFVFSIQQRINLENAKQRAREARFYIDVKDVRFGTETAVTTDEPYIYVDVGFEHMKASLEDVPVLDGSLVQVLGEDGEVILALASQDQRITRQVKRAVETVRYDVAAYPIMIRNDSANSALCTLANSRVGDIRITIHLGSTINDKFEFVASTDQTNIDEFVKSLQENNC